MKNQKIKPCLRCDKPMRATPEIRLCQRCHEVIKASNLSGGYKSKNLDGPVRRKYNE
jgi:hypothetical protein